ncbi:MAG TPA: hypothetical protein VF896_05860 [Anaerolineales bacterium]
MKLTSWLHYFWKVPICGLLFFIGFIPGSQLATWIGLPMPDMPIGADQSTVAQYTLLGSLILALGLGAIARGLSGKFFSRWLILFFFTWIAYGVNNYFEAAIFSTMSAASLYAVVLYFPAALLCSAVVVWLFPLDTQPASFFAQARTFFAGRSISSWAWRLLAAFLAFPVAYYLLGSLIAPIVLPYYIQGTNQLRLPGWDQILPVLALRSLLFLLVCLPILIAWKLSDRRLFLTLGLVLFILVGGLSMWEAYWLAPVLRVTHSLEIFADEMIYAGALILLLRRHITQPDGEQILVPVQ